MACFIDFCLFCFETNQFVSVSDVYYNSSDPSCHIALCVHTTSKLC